MSSKTIQLDVREDIRAGREPFSKIRAAVAQMGTRGVLVLTAPFEPTPLYGVLEAQGFTHVAKELAGGDWEIRFAREAKSSPRAEAEAVHLDARGLEPPQPMVKIFEALAVLPDGAVLHALTDRRPVHLYPQLEARGFRGESTPQPDGSFLTVIRHAR